MKRRNFIQSTGMSIAGVLISEKLVANLGVEQNASLKMPEQLTAIVNGQNVQLTANGKQTWIYQETIVELINQGQSIYVTVQAPKVKLSSINLIWKIQPKTSVSILNDHIERTYGDVSWHKPLDNELLPWYFMERNGNRTSGFGVKTGTKALCYWQIGAGTLSLILDTRSGGEGVILGDRKLEAAQIVTIESKPEESVFETTRRFTKVMCDKARMPRQPVYGINDWYFTYGNTSEKLILEHTRLMAPMADGLENRPFSLIDAGWFKGPPQSPDYCCWGEDMKTPNIRFGDMGRSAQKIKEAGMRPGIWTRPLCGSNAASKSLMLPMIKGREEGKPVLDPTIDENIEKIRNYFGLYNEWGYEMVKFDFTTFDIFGRWGFEMLNEGSITPSGWHMNDQSKTNAEIILDLYNNIRDAAGDTYIISCNTISHLSAGLFELNRIGDDTSGKEWDRTRKMGVNTLAFRGLHHDTFYGADGDCVGLTSTVPWIKNKQWMELVAKSGTPLFISAQPEATGSAQKTAIKECFRLASQLLPVGEPLDWMEHPFPRKWKLNGNIETFDWE